MQWYAVFGLNGEPTMLVPSETLARDAVRHAKVEGRCVIEAVDVKMEGVPMDPPEGPQPPYRSPGLRMRVTPVRVIYPRRRFTRSTVVWMLLVALATGAGGGVFVSASGLVKALWAIGYGVCWAVIAWRLLDRGEN